MTSRKSSFVLYLAADPPLESHVRELERYLSPQKVTLRAAHSGLTLFLNYAWLKLCRVPVHLFSSRNTGRYFTLLQRLPKVSMISVPEIYLDERIKERRFFFGAVIVKTEACKAKAASCTRVTTVQLRTYFKTTATPHPSERELLATSICFVSQATKHIMSNEYFDDQSKGAVDGYRLIVQALAKIAKREQVVVLLRPQESEADQIAERHWYSRISPYFVYLPADRALSSGRALVARLLVAYSSTVALDVARDRAEAGKETLFLTTGKLGLTDLSATGGIWEIVASVEGAQIAIEKRI